MGKALRIAAHVLLFLVATAVFFAGLGIGLQHNPNLGTLLWIVAAAIVVLNLVWLFRWRDWEADLPKS